MGPVGVHQTREDLCAILPREAQINYTKLSKAFQYLTHNPVCQFLVTNNDRTFPGANGLLPGTGSISAPLRFALERDPISTGKPADDVGLHPIKVIRPEIRARNTPDANNILTRVNFDPASTIMVGDRLNTDILFGQVGGLATPLVLIGM